jgi:hypothetical protein
MTTEAETREAVRELVEIVGAQQKQLDALRAVFDCLGSPAAVAHELARFDALRAGRPPAEGGPVVEIPPEDEHAWV